MTRCGIMLFIAALLLQMPAARSAPLGKDGCAQLKVEQGELEKAGTRGSMGRGPQWAKTNLAPEKLDQIRRLLEVDEELLFRCHGKPLVNLPKDPDPDPAAREPDAKNSPKDPAAKAGRAPKGKRDAVKKAAAQPAAQAAKGGAKEAPEASKVSPEPKASPAKTEKKTEKKTAQKSTAAKKGKSKQKADDAYRAPASEPGANPFANQLPQQ
jgi:hypothetical protein